MGRKKTLMPIHIRPQVHRYKGGFTTISRCTKCGVTGLREDVPNDKPCPFCRGRVLIVTGKWVTIQLNKKWWQFWKSKHSGYWLYNET